MTGSEARYDSDQVDSVIELAMEGIIAINYHYYLMPE